MPVTHVDPPHPATQTVDQLLGQCQLRTQARSGPGGQHRNKTSSGVFLRHEPTGIVGEATERRSQADNREVAMSRLRLKLAVEVRTPSILDGPVLDDSVLDEGTYESESELREAYRGNLQIGDRNEAKPAILALVLNDLYAAGGQPSAVATQWRTSTSSLVRFIKSHPPAFALTNAIRAFHGRGPLK